MRPGSVRHLTVGGTSTFTIRAGAERTSDPVWLPVSALESVTVTLYSADPTGPATYHAQAMTLSYRATSNHATDTDAAAFTESWYYLADIDTIDVLGAPRHRDGVVLFDDSLTNGFGSTPGTDNRFPDQLAEQLAAAQ